MSFATLQKLLFARESLEPGLPRPALTYGAAREGRRRSTPSLFNKKCRAWQARLFLANNNFSTLQMTPVSLVHSFIDSCACGAYVRKFYLAHAPHAQLSKINEGILRRNRDKDLTRNRTNRDRSNIYPFFDFFLHFHLKF